MVGIPLSIWNMSKHTIYHLAQNTPWCLYNKDIASSIYESLKHNKESQRLSIVLDIEIPDIAQKVWTVK